MAERLRSRNPPGPVGQRFNALGAAACRDRRIAFVLEIQAYAVDRYLKEDMRMMISQRELQCGDVDEFCFYEFRPEAPSQDAFIKYVEGHKWPLHVYSVDPVIDQQNVLDAFSRRTELQLALAASVAAGRSTSRTRRHTPASSTSTWRPSA